MILLSGKFQSEFPIGFYEEMPFIDKADEHLWSGEEKEFMGLGNKIDFLK